MGDPLSHTLVTLQQIGTKVNPEFEQPGKRAEFMSLDPVEVHLINIQPLR